MPEEIKYICNDDTDEVSGPRKLTLPEQYALGAWLPPESDFNRENSLEAMAYWRNVSRISSAFGPHLIAILSEAGALEPEQDPEQALRNVLKAAGY